MHAAARIGQSVMHGFMRSLGVPFVVLALALSSSAGGAAQSSDSEGVSAELLMTSCGIDVRWGGGGFGTWAWNGSAWVATHDQIFPPPTTPPTTSVILIADILNDPPGGCDVIVSFGGLSSANGSIPTENFQAASSWSGAFEEPSGWSHDNVTASEIHLTFRLVSIPGTVPSGTYAGTVTVTVSNAV